MNRKKLWGGAIAMMVLAVASGIYYLSRPQTDEEPISVKIGYQALASSWAFYVANEKLPGRDRSFFEEEGLQVEAIQFDSANRAAEAMLRGDIATDSATTMTVLLNIEESAPGTLKCFGFQMHTQSEFLESFIASPDSGIQGYEDLKGKTIGVFPGSLNQAITKLLLRDYLNPEKDVEIVQMAPPIQLQAIASGQVDALISYEPTTSLALQQGVAKLVEDSPWARHIFEPFPVATYCFTTQYMREHPETAPKIARAWWKAIEYIRSHRAQASATIPAYTKIDPALAKELNQPAQQTSTEVNQQAVQRLADVYYSLGLVSKKIDTSEIYYSPEKRSD